MLQFLHAADFHLDTPFGAPPAAQAAARRRERRETLFRLADYVNTHHIPLVLLAGDLFDSAGAYRDTGEALAQALGKMEARVFIAPGNHDWYGPGSPWQTVSWPENVHVFREAAMTAVEVPEWNAVIHGAAFTSPEQPESLLAGFTAPADGKLHLGVLHGEADPAQSRYDPIRSREIRESGLHYLALGHIHKRTEPLHLGNTLCAWPGCLEGRGFDELGEKGFYLGEAENGAVTLRFVPFARHRYEILRVDVTDRDPLAAAEAALPPETEGMLCRILLTGEGELPHLSALEEALAPRFFALQLRDRTRLPRDLWQRREEDTLTGLFLRELWPLCQADPDNRIYQLAARFGLAALEGGEDPWL